MAAQKGKALLLKIGDGEGPENFTTIAGLRAKSLSFNAETVDITNADSANEWRELLAGAGIKSASVSGSGVFKDDAIDGQMRSAFFNQTLDNWQVIIPDFGIIEGPFQVTNLDYAGEYNGEVNHTVALESAGELTFTAL